MKRSCFALLILLLAAVGTMLADQTTSSVQQALKEQGFYYGDVTGQKTAETTAAIRRYQIRNGLQITGEIDAETLRSLGVGSSAARSAVPPRPQHNAAPEEGSDNGEPPVQSAEISPQAPSANYPSQRGPDGMNQAAPNQPRYLSNGVFAGTPYEIAPPDLQRHVVVGAQTLLSRYGFYRSGIDGEFGVATQTALRGFQARAGIVADGRLNMETLGALGLLPGQHAPGFRTPALRFHGRPIYRGEVVPFR